MRVGRRVAALGVSALLAACAGPRPAPEPETAEPAAPTRPVPRAEPRALPGLSVIAVGDVMLGTDYPDDRTPPAGHPGIMAPVADILRDADITFVNYEGVLMDGGEPEKVCETPSLCFLFRSPTRLADQLTHAGVDVVSLANNHARDFGETGRTASMQVLDERGIHHSGRVDDIARWTVDGVEVALIAFAPNPGSHDLNDIPGAVARVRALAAEADLVIVSMHGGAEGADAVHVPDGPETYYGEQRGDLRRFSRAVIDAGADLVIGHGPHVPRGMELYKDRLIAYSLGNFATHWGIKVTGRNGLAPILKVDLTGDGEFVEGRIISAHQVRPDGVYPDEQNRAARLMMQLTQADFPDTPLIVTPLGELKRADLLQRRHQ